VVVAYDDHNGVLGVLMTVHVSTEMEDFVLQRSQGLKQTPDQYAHMLIARDYCRLHPPAVNEGRNLDGRPIDVLAKGERYEHR